MTYKELTQECTKCKFKKQCDDCGYRMEREEIIISAINDLKRIKGFPPSVREVAKQVGISPSAAHNILTSMKKKGYVNYGNGKSRILTVL